MRRTLFSTVPMLALLAAAPAGAQVSARIQIGRPPVGFYGQIRPVVIYDYSPSYFGDWDDYYWDWAPVTLYFLDGRYYEQPFRNARPVLMYRYRDRFFAAPRDYSFQLWDRQWGRASGRVFRDEREFRDFRDRGNGRFDPRYDNRSRPVNPRDDGRSRGGQVAPRGGQVAPRDDGRSRGGQVAPRGGQVAPRDDGQSRGGQVAPRDDRRGRGGQAPPSSGRGGRGGQADSHGGRSRP